MREKLLPPLIRSSVREWCNVKKQPIHLAMSRKNIFFIWSAGSIVLMLITACISITIWHLLYKPEPDITWQPLDHIFGMIFSVPVGWLLSFLTPFGWANFFFMCISLYTKLPYILLGSAIATILSGAWWPITYTTMLSM